MSDNLSFLQGNSFGLVLLIIIMITACLTFSVEMTVEQIAHMAIDWFIERMTRGD